jgi:hypothetical protein
VENVYFQSSNTSALQGGFFRLIFHCNFNIGFNSPHVDVCSLCLEYKEKLKRETVETEKLKLMTFQRIRAKAFFESLREERDNLLTVSFDCEKKVVLPKRPDQITYYKRQMYLYNLTAVVGSSKTKLTKENVFIHTWLENQLPKGSNQISSAIFDVLNKLELSTFVETIRFNVRWMRRAK